jgi:peroxiredoxin Q/BCP
MGRMPALMVIDKAGVVRHKHYGDAMSDIPPSSEILAILDALDQEGVQG